MKDKEANILATDDNAKDTIGKCIICKIPLKKKYDTEEARKKTPDRFILQCPKCEQWYFPKYEIFQHEEKFGSVHDDVLDRIQTEGIGIFDGPILLSSKEDTRWFPKEKQKRDYLQDHFGGHVDIVSRDY
jgi:hypothetical protein